MDISIEWAPVRSIAAAAADDQQQLASQAANELRMRSLQVRHSYLLGNAAHCHWVIAGGCSLVHLYLALHEDAEGWRLVMCDLRLGLQYDGLQAQPAA